MSDYRIQKQINAASKACRDLLQRAYDQKKVVSKSALTMELMTLYNITPRAATQIVEIASEGMFELEEGKLIPNSKKGKA